MGIFDWIKGKRSKADHYDRTVVQLPAQSRMAPVDPAQFEKAPSQGAMKIRFAQNETAFEGATILAQKRYAWRGYPGPKLASNPNRITIMTYQESQVVGTVTVGYDSDQGLLADEIYKDKVDELRQAGCKVGELSKLAVDEEHGSKQVLAGMIHIAFLYGVLHHCTDAVIEVVPRHQTFYEKKLGFRQLGEPRMNHRVHQPVVLMHLPLAEMQQKIESLGGLGKKSPDRSLYPYFFSAEEQREILARLLEEQPGA
jgi:hypothetical protein